MGSVEIEYDYIDLPLMDETFMEISMSDGEHEYNLYLEMSDVPEYMTDHIQNQNSLMPSRDINGLLEGDVDE